MKEGVYRGEIILESLEVGLKSFIKFGTLLIPQGVNEGSILEGIPCTFTGSANPDPKEGE